MQLWLALVPLVVWDLATRGKYEAALRIYRWFTPLLHLDTHPKLVQYIKLAMGETGLGSETVRAARLPLVPHRRRVYSDRATNKSEIESC